MNTMRSLLLAVVLFLAACSTVPRQDRLPTATAELTQPSLQRLSDADIATMKAMLARLQPYIDSRRKAGTQALLTFDELYQQLDPEETRLVRFINNLQPGQIGVRTPWMGYGDPGLPLVPLNESYTGANGARVVIPTQYLPAVLLKQYQAMMAAMQEDIGKRLYIASGHRSGAYQLYLFCYYLQNHDWSIIRTGRLVALPGYSEHGSKNRQAVDFISDRVGLDDENEKFENLPQYVWLQQNAARFGFALSYPKGSSTGIAFEPWHWHFKQNASLSAPAVPSLKEPPDEIEDIRNIPQDTSELAAGVIPVPADEQRCMLGKFRRNYFSPWESAGPRYNISDSIKGMKGTINTVWYGENRLKLQEGQIRKILQEASLETLPSMNRPGIAISPTFLRGLPSMKPLYEASDDFPFDQLQYSEVKQNEPLRILHESASGSWLFVETSYGFGWVQSEAVRTADKALRQRLSSMDLVVITSDFPAVRDETGRAMPQPRTGVLYPLLKEEAGFWLVELAAAGTGDQAVLKSARIDKKDAQRFPMPFNARNVAEIGNELMKTPYGWGELFRNRDCSATTRDFFIPFGIWLPRNSMEQLHSGPFIPLENLSKTDREKRIIQDAVPFRTIIHRKGHIMLYAGTYRGRPIVLHTAWAIRYRGKGGQEEKFYLGRTVLTTLEAGSELPLTRGTHLDHVGGMLTLAGELTCSKLPD